MPREPDRVYEASELGYPPGKWPKSSNFGEVVHVETNEDEDILFVDYMDREAEILTRIFND